MEATMKQWFGKLTVRAHDQRGMGLAECIVAFAILVVTVTAFVAALSAGSIAVGEQDEQVAAQRLVRTQLEYVKGYPYNPSAVTYPIADTLQGYVISVQVGSIPEASGNTDIQKITVTIQRDGASILTGEDYKVNR